MKTRRTFTPEFKSDMELATWRYEPNGDDYTLTPERRAVLTLLSREPGLYARQVSDRLNKNPGAVRQLLSEMKRAGLVVSVESQYYPSEPVAVSSA